MASVSSIIADHPLESSRPKNARVETLLPTSHQSSDSLFQISYLTIRTTATVILCFPQPGCAVQLLLSTKQVFCFAFGAPPRKFFSKSGKFN